MEWTQEETTRVLEPCLLTHEAIRMSVGVTENGRIWQHFLMSFGVFSDTAGDHKATWPREAIKEARERLDEFEEAFIQNEDEQEEENETDLA